MHQAYEERLSSTTNAYKLLKPNNIFPGYKGKLNAFHVIFSVNYIFKVNMNNRIAFFFKRFNSSLSQSKNTAGKQDTNTSIPHRLHILSTRNNYHMTLVGPNNCPQIKLSAGTCGFKRGKRSSYDAAHTVAVTMFSKIDERERSPNPQKRLNIDSLELIFRGFAIGRTAIIKSFGGVEAAFLVPKITAIADATRLKFGGCRSKNHRRV